MRFSRPQLALRYATRNPYFIAPTFLLLAGMMFTSLSLPRVCRDARLSLTGERTKGTVTHKIIAAAATPAVVAAGLFAHGGRKRSPSYQLRYEFAAAGRVFGGTMAVSQHEWDAACVGQLLDIVFLPSDPQVNRAGPSFLLTKEAVQFWIGLAALVAWLRFVVAGLRDVARKVRLIAEGAPALAVIDRVEVSRTRKGAEFLSSLKYTFLMEQNGEKQLCEAESKGIVPYLLGEVKAGDMVLVVYDPSDTVRQEIDRFDARREDRLRLLAEAGR
jgi:hypothetical protein